MDSVKEWWRSIRETFRPNEIIKVYNHELEKWVTVTIPRGRQDLLEARLNELENSECCVCALQKSKVPKTASRPKNGIEERNEWIRNVELKDLSSAKREEYIKLLGSDCDSLEALLSIPVSTSNDPNLHATGPWHQAKQNWWKCKTAAEMDLLARLGNDLIATLFLWEIKSEVERRVFLQWVRNRGYCCKEEQRRQELEDFASETECCEKSAPEQWELDWDMVEQSARIRKFRELKKSGVIK